MKLVATLAAVAFAAPALAQDKPAAEPAPSWHGGKPPAMPSPRCIRSRRT